MLNFSQSKLLALRQCPKRLWLEIHRPELREDSADSQASLRIGPQLGDIARQTYDPHFEGALVDVQSEGLAAALERTRHLVNTSRKPIFGAVFCAGGAVVFADVLLPKQHRGNKVWRMVVVKSIEEYWHSYSNEVAIQAFVVRAAGVPLQAIARTGINCDWLYPGNGNYNGILKKVDMTAHAFSRSAEVQGWIAQAQSVSALPAEPAIDTGYQCESLIFGVCVFYGYCHADKPKEQMPIYLTDFYSRADWPFNKYTGPATETELACAPDELLDTRQLRIKSHTLNNTVFFDSKGAATDLAAYSLPAYFLDFVNIEFDLPIWPGARADQFHTFQFSLHTLSEAGQLGHTAFLDISGADPAFALADALVAACGTTGPVYMYDAAFKTAQIKKMAMRFPCLKAALLAIYARVVDLLPIARERYYHPSQRGSWGLKKVLPAIAPDLRYDALEGVRNTDTAIDAFQTAIHPKTSIERKTQLEQQLLTYCKQKTYGMVRLWQMFAARTELKI